LIFIAIVVQSAGFEVSPALGEDLHKDRNTNLTALASSEVYLINVIDTSSWNPPSPDPVGIDYHPGKGRLIVIDSEVDETGIFQGANIFVSSTGGQLVATCDTLSFSRESPGIAVNPVNGHIFISGDDQGNIFEVDPAWDGDECSFDQVVNTIDTHAFNSFDPEGIAYGEGKLFIADGADDGESEIYVLSPGENEVFDGVLPIGDDQVTHFDTLSLGLKDPEGIGFHPERGTLFMVSRTEKVLIETTQSGMALAIYDLSFTDIIKPSGVGIGPGSQDPENLSIYIASRGIDNDLDPNENDGKIFEFGVLEKNYFPLIFR
jgi:hypothetical protein